MSYSVTSVVQELLKQYETYKAVNEELQATARRLAKQRLLGGDALHLQNAHDTLQQKLQTISDEMTFADPMTWIGYKLEAYRNEAQTILTMHDLRVHCSKPGYICTKRYTFLNEQSAKQGVTPLNDAVVFPDEMPLEEVLLSSALNYVKNETFIKKWHSYEYYKDGKRVAKWENYVLK